jgi:ketosteroid isomerase-like protein
MKKLTIIATLIIISAVTGFAQSGDEKAVRQFIADYDQSYLKQDISFMEANLADDYTFSDPSGSIKNRAQVLEDARNEKTAPTEKTLSFESEIDSVRIFGNMAIVSGNWTWSGVPLTEPQTEPHNDKGRFMTILEKRKGKWLLVAEQFTEAQHDRKLMEAQVLKKGAEYNRLIQNGTPEEMEKFLANEYIYTTETGIVVNKAEELENHTNRSSKIESIETTDQKVRILGNNTAVETATIRFRGTDKDGKPFDNTERYTTTWVWRGLRWQIVSDHSSPIKK